MKSDSIRGGNRVLFSVLNWGLGHATRSIPIIRELLKRGYTVTLASDGRAGLLLKKEFPDLEYFEIPGYQVRYPFKSMRWNIALQWPRILWAIVKEHLQIRRFTKSHPCDLIISDNRYGCWSRRCPSVIVTHQINPPTGGPITDGISRFWSLRFLNCFDLIWVPDDPALNLAGPMTQNAPQKTRWIGVISRFKKRSSENSNAPEVFAVLSGPEPLRTRFEERVLRQLEERGHPFRMVRGVTEGSSEWRRVGKHGMVADFLTSSNLEKCICESKLIIGRSGYTSILDYLVLGKKCILVPTPGQYEQELLEEYAKHPDFIFRKEEDLDLTRDVDLLSTSSIASPKTYDTDLLNTALDEVFG